MKICVQNENNYNVRNCYRVVLKLEGLVKNNMELSNVINGVINDNWSDVWNELKNGINNAVALVIANLMENILKELSYDDFFLDSS